MKRTQNNLTFQKNTKKSIFVAFFALSLLAAMTLIPIDYGVRGAEAVDGEVESTLTLSFTSTGTASANLEDLSSEEKTQLRDGIFIKSSAIGVSVATNHYSGYQLLISANDDAGNLTGTTIPEGMTSSTTIASIGSTLTEAAFSAAGATEYSDKWGYSYSVAGTNMTTYYPSPTTTATRIDMTNAANTTAKNYSLGFGARISNATPVGTYAKSLILAAVVNPISYVINYNTNTTSAVTNMPTSGAGTTTETTATVSTTKPKRDGYLFGGWCTVPAASEDEVGNCTGDLFRAGGEFGINQTSTNSLNLYAVWSEATMQKFDMESCMDYTDSPAVLKDERDNKEYTVRYINGGCWMTQNLSFDITTGMTLSSDTTNLRGLVPEGSTEIVTTTLGTVGDLTSGNTYTEARTHVATEEELTSTKLTAEENGYWYNYCAASAGQICVSSSKDEATIDICPANWKMPSDTEWNNIGGDGSYSKTYVDQFSPVAAGYWYNSTLYNPSTNGRWWSTTAYNTSDRYYLIYYPSSGLYSGNLYYRYLGFSVRCMLSL